jgi:hypothetical protein
LLLNSNFVGDVGASALAVALNRSNTLTDLDLSENRIGSGGASAIADALCSNDDLNLIQNAISDDGATSMMEILTSNTTLATFDVGCFDERGLEAFVSCLLQMDGLKTLGFRGDITGFTSEGGNALVQALERDIKLDFFESYSITQKAAAEIMSKVNRLLALKRGGRRLLTATGASVPPRNYWPRILGRSSDNANVLFYFLREKPFVILSCRRPVLGHGSASARTEGLNKLFSEGVLFLL